MKALFFCLALLATNAISAQQPGALDNDFDGDGRVIRNLNPFKEQGNGIAIQQDGKILLCGTLLNNSFDAVITRYFPDGSVDNNFGTNGTVYYGNDSIKEIFTRITVLPDGKILAGGWINTNNSLDFALVRFGANGLIDNTFGVGGFATADFGGNDAINDIAVMPDGKILAVGESVSGQGADCAIARYNYNGTLDTGFSFDGKVTTVIEASASDGFSSVLLQPNGKTVCVGYANGDAIVIRYKTDGTLDPTFDNDGIGRYDIANQASDNAGDGAILANGDILVCGTAFIQSDYDFALLKVDSTGAVVPTFGNNGIILTNISNINNDYAFSMIAQPDGKFIVAGSTGGDVAAVRYDASGSKDNSFGNNGIVITDVLGSTYSERILEIALQGDGKLVACGTAYSNAGEDQQSFVLRYLTGLTIGLLEFSQTKTALLLYPNPLSQTETLKFTLAEKEQITISLIDGQGKLITTFAENQILDKGDHEQILNMPSTLPNGTYFIRLASAKGTMSIRAIK